MCQMNKRGFNILPSTIIFYILNVVFFAALFIFVVVAGSGVSVAEQTYAKQIAFLIDEAKPGTNLEINIAKFYEVAEKNKYKGKLVNFDYGKNTIVVKLVAGGGYSFRYFTNLKPNSITLDEDKKLLKINC